MNQQHTTEDDAAVASFHDDPIEVVRVIAGLTAQYAGMTELERRGQPSPVRPDSPMAQAAVRICLLHGYAEDGNELPGFMERAALREFEANPTREMRALDEAMALAASAQPADPWISVSERLPEIRQDVLVDCGYLTVGQRTDDKQDPENFNGWVLDFYNGHERAITYWMPLPKPRALKGAAS